MDSAARTVPTPNEWRGTSILALRGAGKWGFRDVRARSHRLRGRVIGSTRYMNIEEGASSGGARGTGLGGSGSGPAVNTEAKTCCLRHAFENLGCMRVELRPIR